jgi:stress-induced morphogen
MISPEALCEFLKNALGEAHVEAFDKTGEQNHYLLYVRSPIFAGKPLMARHRLVQNALKPLMESGQLHATEIKTDVPETTQA